MGKVFKTKDVINKTIFNYENKDFPSLNEKQLENIKKIKIMYGDITKVSCDAIVNSAKTNLLGGAGVDGAIHAAAGPKLKQECITLNGCETGEAKYTKGYKLPCRFVIHTVGPVYNRDVREEATVELKKCYYNCLKIANELNCATITFPSISTGIYGFPTRLALPAVFMEITKALSEFKKIKQVNLICYTPIQYKAYTSYLEEITKRAKF